MTTETLAIMLLVWVGAAVGFILGYQLAHAQVMADIVAILNDIRDSEEK